MAPAQTAFRFLPDTARPLMRGAHQGPRKADTLRASSTGYARTVLVDCRSLRMKVRIGQFCLDYDSNSEIGRYQKWREIAAR